MTIIPPEEIPHQQNAEAIRNGMQQLVLSIRGFSLSTTERRRKITLSGHVDDDFLRGMALLIEAHPDVAAVCQITPAEILDHLSFSGSYSVVGDELTLNGRKVNDTITAERATVGERALRALKIARSVNFPAGSSSLVPHVEALDREFRRGRRRRNKPPVEESPEVKP
jgi:hypothetical protein